MPKMTETEFKKHITSKKFAPIYAIWGSEKKYVRSYTNKLTEKICGKNPSEFNFHQYTNGCDIHQVCLDMLTVPFMSDYNVIKLSDINFSQLTKEEKSELESALKSIVQGTVVIFTMPTLNIDEKKPGDFKKIMTIAEKSGVAVVFNRLGDLALERHLVSLASRQNVKLSAVNADKIISICGNDLTSLVNELDKLCAYAGEGNEITTDDIMLLTTANFEAKVFSLADFIVKGKNDEALKTLNGLFFQRQDPIAVLTVLSNAYVDFYRGKTAFESGVQYTVAAEDFNCKKRAFVLKKTVPLSANALSHSIDLIIGADTAMKTQNTDGRIILEELVCRLLEISKKGNAYD